MNILVTGGYGFIGSHFINYTMQKFPDCMIVNIDCMNYCANKNNVWSRDDPRYVYINSDLQDKEFVQRVLKQYSISHVVHFAAQTHVDTSFVNTDLFIRDNIVATHVLLEACTNYDKLLCFMYISTDEVYGDSVVNVWSETSPLTPTNPYAATKASAEMLATSYYHSFKLPVIVTRSNNIYGPNQYSEKLIPKFIKLLKDDKKCTVHGSGHYRRSFVHVLDLCNALWIIIEKGSIGQIYNIGSDDEFSVLQIAQLLVKLVRSDENFRNYIEFVNDRPFNDTRYHITCDKIKALGWRPLIPFDRGIKELIFETVHKN